MEWSEKNGYPKQGVTFYNKTLKMNEIRMNLKLEDQASHGDDNREENHK